MIKNYFFLNRLAIELNHELNEAKLLNFFAQEKDRAIIEFTKQNVTRFVEISVNPSLPFITIKRDFRRAKKNTLDLFSFLINSDLSSISICSSDRIIKLDFGKQKLYFAIRGKHTNIIAETADRAFLFFKKEDDTFLKNFKDEIECCNFIADFNQPDFSKLDYLSLDALKKQFPFIGKEILFETKIRSDNELDLQSLNKIIEEMKDDNFKVLVDENSGSVKLSFNSFNQFPFTDKLNFNSAIEAMNVYLPLKFRMEKEQSDEKILRKHLDVLAQRLSQKLNKLKTVIDRESREVEYQKIANLLLINIHLIKPGMKEIELQDIYSEKNIIIKLEPTKSARKNVDNYFEKSRSEKINRTKSFELYERSKIQFENIHKKINEIENGISPGRIIEMMDELRIKPQNQADDKEDIRLKFKRYAIDKKFYVYVGRDSKNNDLLTTKFAKQNDYWFHARSVPGSHVVLKVDNSSDNIPKEVLKKTASLAAYHSKAKTAGMVPVSYTQKKYVVKKKGMEAGKVALLREDVLIVKPEIPKGCEFVDPEQ